MLRSLTLAIAATVAITLSSGRAAEEKPQADKKEQGIKAEVRGTLHFESGQSGRGYFISVKSDAEVANENRVWLRISENKALVQQLQGLDGKEVVAKGRLAQMPEGSRTSVPLLGMYMSRFEIEGAGAR
jgi:hypothetical protein